MADVILVADSDVPWIPAVNRPAEDAVIYCIDSDPVKEQLPLWHVPARRFAAADSRVALAQISAFIREHGLADEELVPPGERPPCSAVADGVGSRDR